MTNELTPAQIEEINRIRDEYRKTVADLYAANPLCDECERAQERTHAEAERLWDERVAAIGRVRHGR